MAQPVEIVLRTLFDKGHTLEQIVEQYNLQDFKHYLIDSNTTFESGGVFSQSSKIHFRTYLYYSSLLSKDFIIQYINQLFPYYQMPPDKQQHIINTCEQFYKTHQKQFDVPKDQLKRTIINTVHYLLIILEKQGYVACEIMLDIKMVATLCNQLIYDDSIGTDTCAFIWSILDMIFASAQDPDYSRLLYMMDRMSTPSVHRISSLFVYQSGRPKSIMPFVGLIPLIAQDQIETITHMFKYKQQDYLIDGSYVSEWDNLQDIGNFQKIIPPNQFNHMIDKHTWIGKFDIPVVRYQRGMSHGLFLSKQSTNEHKYCGLFYYFEPESIIVNRCHKVLIVPNKTTGVYLLSKSRQLIDYLYDHSLYDEQVSEQELLISRSSEMDQNYLMKNLCLSNMIAGEYYTHRNCNYALEDFLDQPLCILARQYNYDAIILAYMTGRNRVVTEFLDVRGYQGFKHLRRLR